MIRRKPPSESEIRKAIYAMHTVVEPRCDIPVAAELYDRYMEIHGIPNALEWSFYGHKMIRVEPTPATHGSL